MENSTRQFSRVINVLAVGDLQEVVNKFVFFEYNGLYLLIA